MKALNMSMDSAARKATKNRVRSMQVLRGGIGSNLLKPHQIEDIIRRKREEREKRQWEKFLRGGNDPRKSKPKSTTPIKTTKVKKGISK